jgi:hypothetical protein
MPLLLCAVALFENVFIVRIKQYSTLVKAEFSPKARLTG